MEHTFIFVLAHSIRIISCKPSPLKGAAETMLLVHLIFLKQSRTAKESSYRIWQNSLYKGVLLQSMHAR